MAKTGEYVCTECYRATPRSEVATKRTFLGFSRFTCPHCQAPVTYPLGVGFKLIYYAPGVICILAGLAGQALFLGGTGIVFTLCALSDIIVMRRVKGAQRRQLLPGAAQAGVLQSEQRSSDKQQSQQHAAPAVARGGAAVPREGPASQTPAPAAPVPPQANSPDSYVRAARAKGISDEEIVQRLMKTGWSEEQARALLGRVS